MKKIKIALLAAVALATSLCVSRAQPLVPNAATSVRFPFTDISTGPSDYASPSDATFGVSLSLTNYNRLKLQTNYHGIYGSGTSGLHVALDLSTNADFTTPPGEGSVLGPGPLVVTTNTALQFGTIQSFTATIWSKAEYAPTAITTLVRLFILGQTGDKAAAGNLALFWNANNQIDPTIGTTSVAGPLTSIPINQWQFYAVTYDGTTANFYTGSDGGGTPVLATSVALAAKTIALTGANDCLQIGNRDSDISRPFCGWIDDFRFYGSTATVTGAASANQVEDIFWAGQAPTNLVGTGGNNQVNLTWSSLANATTYNVSRSSTSGGPYTQIATGLTSPSYPDATAVNGNTYYYVVSAVDGTGDLTTSPNSFEFGITAEPAPTQPVVTPTGGSDQVTLNWTASTGSPGPITYNVGRSSTPGGEVTIATGISGTTYTDSTAVSQLTYYYVVTAINDGLSTATTPSAEVSATPGGPPPAPISVTAAPNGSGQAIISWADASATSYNILQATSLGGPYSVIASGVTGTNYTDTSILLGVDYYYYKVVAVNSLALSSAPSSPSPAVPSGEGNQLVNPGFETTPLYTGWTRTTGVGASTGSLNILTASATTTYYDNAGGMCPVDVPAELVATHNGTNVGNIYDYQAAGSSNFWSQAIGATPNSTWAASGWTLAPHEDLSGPCVFYYELDFLNVGGTLLAAYQSFGVSNLTCAGPNAFPLDTWVSLAVTNQMQVTVGVNTGVIIGNTGLSGGMTAPAGSSTANFKAVFVDVAAHGGSIYFDDCDLDLIAGPVPPTLSAITNTIAGSILCTNTFVTVVASSAAGTITNAQAIITSHGLTGATNSVTNNLNATTLGLGTSTATITNPLAPNLIYNLKILATDDAGNSATTSASFDTMSPILVIEAEDFNFGGGVFIDTPANGGLGLYTNLPALAVAEVDLHGSWGGSQTANGSYYRNTDLPINGYAAPDNGKEQKYLIAAALGQVDAGTNTPLEVGYNNAGDWLDYTRTFGPGTPGDGVSAPVGTYTVWARLATDGAGAALNFYQTSDPTQGNQSSNLLGSFSFTDSDWNGFDYVPLLDSYGNLVSVSLSGVQTLRGTVTGNPNIDFYMLMPSVPVLTPSLLYAYPDGLHPFEPTNHLTFSVGPANGAPVASSAIHLILNGADVTSGLSITPSGNAWTASYPIKSNAVYSAVINVTNTASLSSVININFDTFNPNNFQWEAVDYDFSTNNGSVWVSDLFIDRPVPTCDTTTYGVGHFETNSYFGYPTGLIGGAIAQQGIDINFPNDGQGLTSEYYRADGVGSQPAADYVRQQFTAEQQVLGDANIGVFNIGYYGNGYWLNYTRHYPTNTFNVWGRLAGGAGPFSGTALSMVTSGVGTATQTTSTLGTFSDPNAAGWQTWHWIPLLDANGNMAVITLDGLATLRVTSGNNLNSEFFMLVAAPLPIQLGAVISGPQLQISVLTQHGYTYTLVHSLSLTNPSWTPTADAPVPGDGTVHVFTESTAGSQGYYQVTVQ